MHYEIPIFPSFAVGECEAWPGYLPSLDATKLEPIHKWLRASISNAPEQRERLVCEAVQRTFDMLKRIHEANGSLNRHVLVEELPRKVFGLALDCGWLPALARADRNAWRQWIEKLLEGRYSRTGLGDSCSVDPYMFIQFPLDRGNGSLPESPAGSQTVTAGSQGRTKHVEVAQFESVATSQTKGDVKIPGGKQRIREMIAPGTAWTGVRVVVSDETLRIEICGKATELGFLEAGFGKRDQNLELLKYFAASRGMLHDHFTFPKQCKTPLKSVVSRLRRLLRNLIAIDGDPVEHRKKAGMYTCFQIKNSTDNSFPTPHGATWLDFAFYLQRDGRLRVSVSVRHSFRSGGTPRSAHARSEDLPQPESDVSQIYSFEDLGLRTSASALTREGKVFRALLHSHGKLEADGDDMAVLKLAQWLRTWTGLDGDPLQFGENSHLWTSCFDCNCELTRE
jgi:hypothetical protein